MSVIVSTSQQCALHNPGAGHPESPQRLSAALSALTANDLAERISLVEAPEAKDADLERVHPRSLLSGLDSLAASGGGPIDADTYVSTESAGAARRAAGAGIDLIERLMAGEADYGWSIVRPPGHHALADRQMGFCLINNIAVAAAKLVDLGQRVAIVDIDAHHGNGTQDIFYSSADVLFVSMHQYPFYPGTGAPDEVGAGAGVGRNVNLAMPAGANGSAYRSAIDRVVVPVLDRFDADWLLVSAGFDGHMDDPLTGLGLSATDYAEIVAQLVQSVPKERSLLFLEGGYNLEALSRTVESVIGSLVGFNRSIEPATSGGPGESGVEQAFQIHLNSGIGDW